MTPQDWFHWTVIWTLAGVVTVFCATGSHEAFGHEGSPVEIVVERDTAFFDREIGLWVRGLDPNSETIITMSTTDARGQSWWSQNVYVADENGQVDPSYQGPVRGTYSGVQAMGPFWSMVGAGRFYTSSDSDVYGRISNDEEILAERSVLWLSPRDHPFVAKETFAVRTSSPTSIFPGIDKARFLPSWCWEAAGAASIASAHPFSPRTDTRRLMSHTSA